MEKYYCIESVAKFEKGQTYPKQDICKIANPEDERYFAKVHRFLDVDWAIVISGGSVTLAEGKEGYSVKMLSFGEYCYIPTKPNKTIDIETLKDILTLEQQYLTEYIATMPERILKEYNRRQSE